MVDAIDNIGPDTLRKYDFIIDVRSPAEFAEDHIPGAVSLPVLNNDERARVGAIYKQESRFKARRIGASLVARNMASHLDEFFADVEPDAQLLVYCWRGGMRSGSFATIASQVGWKISTIAGGYRTWRRLVVDGLRSDQRPYKVCLVDGLTGSGKTDILIQSKALGAPVVDLEGAASHRGSVFGALKDAVQPTQKLFESIVWRDISTLQTTAPFIIEAESNRIGRCEIPKRLWSGMKRSKRIIISAPLETRAEYLVRIYEHFDVDKRALITSIENLRPFHPSAVIDEWIEYAISGEFLDLARDLLINHYDPRYQKSAAQNDQPVMAEIALIDLSASEISRAASEIAEITAA